MSFKETFKRPEIFWPTMTVSYITSLFAIGTFLEPLFLWYLFCTVIWGLMYFMIKFEM